MRLGDRRFCLYLCRRLEYLKHTERTREINRQKEKKILSLPHGSVAPDSSPLHTKTGYGAVSRLPWAPLPMVVKLIWNSVISPDLQWSLESSKAAIHRRKFHSIDLRHFEIQHFPFQRALSCFCTGIYSSKFLMRSCRCLYDLEKWFPACAAIPDWKLPMSMLLRFIDVLGTL